MVDGSTSRIRTSPTTVTAPTLNPGVSTQSLGSHSVKGGETSSSSKSKRKSRSKLKEKSSKKHSKRSSKLEIKDALVSSSASNPPPTTSATKPATPSGSDAHRKVAAPSPCAGPTGSGPVVSSSKKPKITSVSASGTGPIGQNGISKDRSVAQSGSSSLFASSGTAPKSSTPSSSPSVRASVPVIEAASVAPAPDSISKRDNPSTINRTPSTLAVAKSSQPLRSSSEVPTNVTDSQVSAIGDNNVVFVNGQAFNSRGYAVCGVENQRGRRCGRIGTCPFHAPDKTSKIFKRPRAKVEPAIASNGAIGKAGTAPPPIAADTLTEASSKLSAAASASEHPAGSVSSLPSSVCHVRIPPQKSRFKRSWTTAEHRLFLHSMRIHGKGKWKEIAADVKTRTANQCQSHAQKYFLRQAKSEKERKKKSIHDVTDDDSRPFPIGYQAPPRDPSEKSSFHKSRPVSLVAQKSPTPILPRRSFSLAPAKNTFQHRATPTTAPLSATLTCLAGHPTHALPAGSTVPVVFPVSSVGEVQYASMLPFLNAGNTASAAVVPPPLPMKRRVTVYINGSAREGKALMLPDDMDQFFKIAKDKLNFKGVFRRVFARSGGQIDSLDEMCPDDVLWLSAGEEFQTPR